MVGGRLRAVYICTKAHTNTCVLYIYIRICCIYTCVFSHANVFEMGMTALWACLGLVNKVAQAAVQYGSVELYV